MGENNETIVEQPIIENAEMGEQPLVPADQNIVATQNEGLMENDPFQERTSEPAAPIQNDTGAVVEEPQPIVEQQIALDVNIDDVFEGGPTKEDEITKIVSDTMGNTPAEQQPEVTFADPAMPPVQQPVEMTITEPVIEQPIAEVPAVIPEEPVVETPVAEVAPVMEPTITLEPGPIPEVTMEPAPAVIEQPVVETPVAEAPVVEIPAPEVPVMPEIPTPEVPVVEVPVTEPTITLEPGVIPEQPVVEMTAAPETPVTAPAAETPVVETPVAEIPAVTPEVPVTEVPITEPTITLEPGPIPETTNPFDGITPNIDATPVAEMAPQADFQQADMSPVITLEPGVIPEPPVAEAAPVMEPTITLEPGVIPEVPVAEVPTVTPASPVTEMPVVEMPTPELPTAELPAVEQPIVENAAPEFTISETPALDITNIATTEVAIPEEPTTEVPTVETPVIEMPTPEMAAAEPVLDPVADFAQQPTATANLDANITLEQVQNEITNQQMIADNINNNALTVPTNMEQQNIIPVPVTEPVKHDEPVVEETTEDVEKTIVLQSTPLGKVQPVAPIAHQGEGEENIAEEKTEEPVVEETTEEVVAPVIEIPTPEGEPEPTTEEPIMPIAEEEPKKKINISDIDDLALKALEDEYKDVELENKKKVNVEKSLYIEFDETEEPKQSRNSKRKLITGDEKFHSNKRVVQQPVNEPIVRFCSSCGNIVKKEDIVCSQCGDPIE